MEEQKIVVEDKELQLRKRMDIFMSLGQYKRAQDIGDQLGLKIKIQDPRGVEYYIDKNGSIRRTVPKRKKRGKRF